MTSENESSQIDLAVDSLDRGELIVVPTETVYGLAADAFNEEAVAKIFEAKGRPATNPLIVHVADIEQAKRVTSLWTDEAEKLAATYWPGPLTLVLPKAANIPSVVTAGGTTVAVRVPRHPLFQKILARGSACAAPSANRSNRISPTSVEQLDPELLTYVAQVIDGGRCEIGIESTVVSLVNEIEILRPGDVSADEISVLLGRPINVSQSEAAGTEKSPGRLKRHYAPVTPTELVDDVERVDDKCVAVIVYGPTATDFMHRFELPCDPASYAREIYSVLFHADQLGVDRIVIQDVPKTDKWTAVRDRLKRATS